MDWGGLAVFVKVVEAGSFSAAARLMKMPKTTVSAKVAALEKRLGVHLIQRTTRKLHVTEAGARYYHHCANAVREVELGEAALSSIKDQPSGLLRLTAPIDLGHTLLPGIVSAYLGKYPDTRVEMLLSNQVFDLVGEGMDLAIRAGKLQDSTLIARRFFELEMKLWAAASYLGNAGTPQHPRDLASHALVGYTGMKSLQLSRGRAAHELPVNGRLLTDDFVAIRAMLVLGAGIGPLPDFVAAEAHASGLLTPVLPAWKLQMDAGFSFVYPGQKYASPKVQAFIETALAVVGGVKDA